jgi:peptidoglycan/xylan/chitin deacetylase (PgdA/CDA1 family)
MATSPAHADIVTRLPTSDKVVALTFDACEAPNRAAFFDHGILGFLERRKLPFTIFATGLFARRNRDELARLAASPLVEVENHSFDHPQHMQRLDAAAIARQVAETDRLIAEATGRTPKFFRFPAGNYDAAALAAVEASGHKVVHWRFPSGDPAAGLTSERLRGWVIAETKPGDILIFHINGRAPATAGALPAIVDAFQAKGWRFVRLDEVLK